MKKTPILLVLVGALLAIPAAGAHVTISPRTLPANSFSSFAISVPDEHQTRRRRRSPCNCPQTSAR